MLSEKHFLYVEDDFPSRIVLQKLMKSMGVTQFSMFEDSTDFMDRFKALENWPDIVLLDIHMQPYNGFEVLRMLRDDPDTAQLTVVALTASVMNEEVDLLRTSGFDGVISKPVRMSRFPTIMERVAAGEPVWEVT